MWMANVYRQVYKEIKKHELIVIARHIGADPDALGSEFAFKSLILNKFPKKRVYAIGNPSNRFKFMGELDRLDDVDVSNALLIVLDTPDLKRIDGAKVSDYKTVIKIDHHPIVDSFGDIEVVDDSSSSTSQLILEFVFRNRLRLTEEIARSLYKSFGFREVALRKFYYGDEDGILMEKQVM